MDRENIHQRLMSLFAQLQRHIATWEAESVQGGRHMVNLCNRLGTLQLVLEKTTSSNSPQRLQFSPKIEDAFPDLRARLSDRHRVYIEDHFRALRLSLYLPPRPALLFCCPQLNTEALAYARPQDTHWAVQYVACTE